MSSANITNHLAPELTRQTALQDGRRMSSSAALVMPSVVLAVISFAIYTKVRIMHQSHNSSEVQFLP